MREFAPLYEDAARPFRHRIGSTWSVDETYATVAGKPLYVYRAIDGHGQVVGAYVSERRATADVATYPPALTAVLPGIGHEAGKQVQ